MTVESLALLGGADLKVGTGNPVDIGLLGVFVVEQITPGGNQVRPGGDGLGTNIFQDDDFRVTFANPVRAAGLTIIDNLLESGESIRFYDPFDQLLGSAALPGGNSGTGGSGFVGSGGESIAYFEIEEGGSGSLTDDILFDDIRYSASAVPEPSTAGLLALVGTVLLNRRRRR